MIRGMLWTSLVLWAAALVTIAVSVGWVASPLLAGWSAVGLVTFWLAFHARERALLILGAGALTVLCILAGTLFGLFFIPSSLTLLVAAGFSPAPSPTPSRP